MVAAKKSGAAGMSLLEAHVGHSKILPAEMLDVCQALQSSDPGINEMLKEIIPTRQIPNEPRRVWFIDDEMDLIVWFGETDEIVGFQLCDDKGVNEHALTWFKADGYSFERVDDGEGRTGHLKMTPILLPDGVPDVDRLLLRFCHKAKVLPKQIRSFVREKLRAFQRELAI